MAASSTMALKKGHLLLLASTWFTFTAALAVDICASFNTADMNRNVSIYQTNGLCHDFCVSKAAFAITQANSCWCSDFYPDKASTVDVSKCNIPCPAWQPEFCGGPGLFGYIALNEFAPSGTKSAPGPTSTSQATVTSTSTTTSETQTTSSRSSSDSSSTTPPPTTSAQSTSDGGNAKTVTFIPTDTASPNGDQAGMPVQSSGLKSGAIAGIAVGVVGAVLVVAGILLFWFLRRRKQNQGAYQEDPSVRGSSSGMIGSIHPEMSINGNTPASPGSVGNRNSTIMIDPRMDPFKQGLYARGGSHESINTLRDEHDYSRRIQAPKVLRAVNPDPE